MSNVFNHGSFKYQDCMGDAIHAVYPMSRFSTQEQDYNEGTDFIFGSKERIDYRLDFTINDKKSHVYWTREYTQLGGIQHVIGVRTRNSRHAFDQPVYVIMPCMMQGFHRFGYNVSLDEVYDLIDILARVEETVMARV
jgi:hypothetical protein